MTTRQIKKTLVSVPTLEGAGVHLKRGFGYAEVPLFDPFLMLDDFHTSNPDEYLAGFPWHPHRGIETITYILEGLVEHGDSMGNTGVIGAGDVQWMTAGSGIVHQEMPKVSPTGTMWGFQFWANLPASQKMMAPRYREVTAATIPETTIEGGCRVKIISGTVNGVQGPVRDIVIDPVMLDVSVPAEQSFRCAVPEGHTAFAYVLSGEADFAPGGGAPGSKSLGPETVVLYERKGTEVVVAAGSTGVRFLLLSGKPLGEPVAWEGSIVMNTDEELRVAYAEFNNGTFIKAR